MEGEGQMKDITEAIKEKRNAIARLKSELDVLERAYALLNGGPVQPPLNLSVDVHDANKIREGKKVRLHPRKGKFSSKSSVGHTVAVLRESSVPLHIGEILNRISKRGHEAKKGSLASTLAKMAKQGVIFSRASQPNTFGLLEWKTTREGAAQ
jgi:hypothetical protein